MIPPPTPARDLAFEQALYESILERDPANIEALMALGESCTKAKDYARGLEIDRRLAHLRPSDALVHYNLACSLSLTGNLDEAFATLGRALDLGYMDLDHLDRDEDLEALRKDPRFAALRRRLLGLLP